MRWCRTVNDDSEVLAAPALAMRYETLVRVSRAIAAHRDLKELFGILMDELHVESTRTYGARALRTQRSARDRSQAILELRPAC